MELERAHEAYEDLAKCPVPAPSWLSTGDAYAAEAGGVPWPVSGDRTALRAQHTHN